jgi:hypothetical protein
MKNHTYECLICDIQVSSFDDTRAHLGMIKHIRLSHHRLTPWAKNMKKVQSSGDTKT